MKKTFIFALAFAAATLFGQHASAQTTYNFDAPALNQDTENLAKEVISLQLSDPEAANKSFTKLLKKIKGDKTQLVAVGKFFLEQNIYPCANQCAKQAYTLSPTDIPTLMLNAYVSMMRKDWGAAGQKFDEILAQDPNHIDALRLNARVYKYVNPIVAKETLEKIISLDPNNPLPYKELGDIAYDGKEDKEAIDAYKKYFEKVGTLEEKDVLPGENYMITLLRRSNDYATVRDLSDKLIAIAPKNIMLRRVNFIALLELVDEVRLPETIKYITEKQFADSAYTYLDYQYAARYAEEMQNDHPTAISYWQKALAIDSTKSEGYKSLAVLLQRTKQSPKAIEAYQQYMKLLGDKATLNDKLGLGRIYIAAKTEASTPEDKESFIIAGDKIFDELCKEAPDHASPMFYRAQLWIKDRNAAEEKPREYFLKTLELLGDKEAKRERKTAYAYLMIYALKKNQDEECMKYVQQILKIDPEDKTALDVQKILKS